jgi:hypothetical protein
MMTKAQLQTLSDTNLASNTNILAVKHREINDELINAIFLPHETRELDCPQEFIDDNFDETGLGINLMVGWQIIDTDGRFTVSYGTKHTVIGAEIGSDDAVVVEHSHPQTISLTDTGSAGGYVSSYPRAGSQNTYLRTDTEGVSGTDKNIPQSVVRLRIKRVA